MSGVIAGIISDVETDLRKRYGREPSKDQIIWELAVKGYLAEKDASMGYGRRPPLNAPREPKPPREWVE